MALTIDNPTTIEQIERRAAALGKTADEVISQALRAEEQAVRSGPLTGETRAAAVRAPRDLQRSYRAHLNPTDQRTPDEVVGYDENGLPD